MERTTPNEARYLLRELPFDDWLMVSVVFPPRTIAKKRMRNLEELALMLVPNEKMYPSVELDKVAKWIEEKVGDTALAKVLTSIVEDEKLNYFQKCIAFHESVSKRCETLRATIGGENA